MSDELVTPAETEVVTLLSAVDRNRLQRLETIVETAIQRTIGAGNALREIRDDRLYRERYATFEDYCRERWNMVRSHANRMIAAAKVVKNLSDNRNSGSSVGTLSPVGDNHNPESPVLPTNESQARPLTRLRGPEPQKQAWNKAVESAGGEQPTAKQVEAAVDEVDPKAKSESESKPKAKSAKPDPWQGSDKWESVLEIRKYVERDSPLSDEEWLAQCPVREKLSEKCRKGFDRDASFYRKVQPYKMAFQAGLKDLLKNANLKKTSAYFGRLQFFLTCNHPRDWKLCLLCNGGGIRDLNNGNGEPGSILCEKCKERGYYVD